jgi:ubiquinone biosynthesis protein UbiJ
MATQSPFSLVSDALTQFAAQTQAPAWVIDETLNRVVLFLNHVISREPEAQSRLARQKGRCIQLQWQDKLIQLSPTPAGLLERVHVEGFDLRLTVTDPTPLDVATALLRGDKPGVRIEGDVQLAAEVNWLIDHVRWEPEEDLAKLWGDAAAHTVCQFARQAVTALKQFTASWRRPAQEVTKATP